MLYEDPDAANAGGGLIEYKEHAIMLDFSQDGQADLQSYPKTGVRIGINYHDQTIGKHRPRFSLDPEVANFLRRGLTYPRVKIDGTFANGLRIWCVDDGSRDGMTPTASNAGNWSFSVPCRRVRSREEHVSTMEVDFSWDRDETGPVLVIPRLPDALVPEAIIDKLPNSQVDMSTIMARADKRLIQEMKRVFQGGTEVAEVEREIEATPQPETIETLVPAPVPEPEPIDPIEPPTPTIVDLKDALQMVNELVDQLGESVVLSIDERGHVRAKRRIVQFIDL
jgi:hypothetical protein